MSRKIVFNGDIVERDKLELGTLDKGFAYGFGLFETLRFFGGRARFFSEHYRRLHRAARELGLELPFSEDELWEHSMALFSVNEVSEGVFKIVALSGGQGTKTAVFLRSEGSRAALEAARVRASPIVKASKAFTSRHKTLNYLDSIRELEQAQEHGFDECLFCNEFGFLTECAVSNVFFIADDVLKTPRLECGLLDGVIRKKVLEIAKAVGMRVEEGSYRIDDLVKSSEAFLTNSSVGILPIREFQDEEEIAVAFETKRVPFLKTALLDLERES